MRKIISRRAVLAASSLLVGSPFLPVVWANTPGRDPRLLIINLRGALDGLAAVMPVGDPALASLRAAFGPSRLQGLPLDSTFQLNGNMTTLHTLYRSGEALLFHAVATPYRSRSHFDAQMVLESGQPDASVSGEGTGWLNRALALTPMRTGQKLGNGSALAVSPTVPLMLRGTAPVETWQPQVLRPVDADLAARLLTVYEALDPAMAAALRKGVDIDTFLAEEVPDGKSRPGVGDRFAATMAAVGKLMAQKDGPRIAVMSIDGWDTHAREGPDTGRLAKQLQALDGGIAALKINLGELWRDATVVIVTEFGRTARVNGTGGTDHGTGGVAMLAGGRVNGGRVIADWPGLADSDLFEGRDLKPTTDLRAVLKGVLAEALWLDEKVLASTVFPDTGKVQPIGGLLHT